MIGPLQEQCPLPDYLSKFQHLKPVWSGNVVPVVLPATLGSQWSMTCSPVLAPINEHGCTGVHAQGPGQPCNIELIALIGFARLSAQPKAEANARSRYTAVCAQAC